MAQSHNTITVSERWTKIYEDISTVDFRAADMQTYTAAIIDYIRNKYPDDFNDFINSSEFVMLMDVLTWLAQNVAFRVDMNSRENFFDTAERRSSLIKLARNLGYVPSRTRGTTGLAKVWSISTTEDIVDSNGVNLSGKTIVWNDPRNPDWRNQLETILNSVFVARTQIGNPLVKVTVAGVTRQQYVMDAVAPSDERMAFMISNGGVQTSMMILNGKLNENGGIDEQSPLPERRMSIFYQSDGKGYASSETGYFLPFVQGVRAYVDTNIGTPIQNLEISIPASSVDENGIFVQSISNGVVTKEWKRVDNLYNEGINFTTAYPDRDVYEVDTTSNNGAVIRFGDGSFGNVPNGTVRVWYRTVDPVQASIKPRDFGNRTIRIPYQSNGKVHTLTLTLFIENTIPAGASADTNDEIRRRARRVYSAQNRIVTAADYNNFLLNDNRISKVSTVNRTFTGQSRFNDVKDPTSLYQTVRQYATDARLYIDTITSMDRIGNPDISNIINNIVPEKIGKADKRTAYLVYYPENAVFSYGYKWTPTSVDNGYEHGNITLNGNIQPLSGVLSQIAVGTILRLDDVSAYVIDITGDATEPGAITINRTTGNAKDLHSFIPEMRTTLTDNEKNALANNLLNRLTFAMSWSKDRDEWLFINEKNIGNGEFSLENQGDNTGQGLDDSWFLKFEFSHAANEWTITERGSSEIIQSSSELHFAFFGTEDIRDPKTGERVVDHIDILTANETKDSPARLGIEVETVDLPDTLTLTGDGTTRKFQIRSRNISQDKLTVTVNGRLMAGFGYDYQLVPAGTSYEISFSEAPAANSVISLTFGGNERHAEFRFQKFDSTGNREFDLNANAAPGNIIPVVTNVPYNTSREFGIGKSQSFTNTLIFNEILNSPASVYAFFADNVSSAIIHERKFSMDGSISQVALNGNYEYDDVLVLRNGEIETGYTVVPNGGVTAIVLGRVPLAGTIIQVFYPASPSRMRTRHHEFTADGTQTTFRIGYTPKNLLVALDGKPALAGDYTVSNGNLIFNSPPLSGTKISVHSFLAFSGSASADLLSTTTTQTGRKFLERELVYSPYARVLNPDGYPDPSALRVEPADLDNDGYVDNPLIFQDFVNTYTDLVFWKKDRLAGSTIWVPIDETTTPKAEYGTEINPDDPGENGNVYYNTVSQLFLEVVDGKYVVADQSAYMKRIGRSAIQIRWTHYSPESRSIDPAKSNIVDAYVLTTSHKDAVITWKKNGAKGKVPQGESPETLKYIFSNFDNYKPTSDELLWHPVSFVPLFGTTDTTDPALQAWIEAAHSSVSTMTDTELRTAIVNSIDDYLSIDTVNMGDRISISQIIARIHVDLQPHLKSVRFVRPDGTTFDGDIRLQDSELPIPIITPSDVTILQ